MLDTVTKALGLVRQYNTLTTAPGAFSKANDCVIRRENVLEPRRGFKKLGTGSAAFDLGAFNFDEYAVFVDNDGKMFYWNGSAITALNSSTTLSNHTGHKIRGVEGFQNCYINDSTGVQVIDGVTDSSGTTRDAGAPRGLDMSYTLTSGASGFLADTFQCAYRHIFKRIDENENQHFGYPSERMWVVNASGGDENVNVTLTLPNDVEEGDVLQVYRTTQASGTSNDASGDEMGLVYEYTVTSSDVTAGSITFTDSITDTLIGATLYTSPSQEGIAQANARPPSARDIALYKSKYMFYGHTSTPHQLQFSLVGTTSLSGKTLTIAGVTYDFGATEITSGAGSPQAKVSSTGVAATDIDETARSLVRVINRYATNTAVYAYYLSGPEDLPGKILLQRQPGSTGSFTIQAEDSAIGAMTFPESPVSPATSTAMTSTSEEKKNRIYYSKDSQPESVPLLNYLPVGPANKRILRIAPLRDSLIIISEAGIYRLTGEDPGSFTVVTLDDTIRVKALETVRVLSNQVIMLTNQGVVRVSENGVEVISREIEIEIQKILNYSSYEDVTRAIVYESERSYLLSSINSSNETSPSITFVFNLFTKTWVRWTIGIEDGIVEERSDQMYYSEGTTSLFQERKSLTDDDFADPETSVTITDITDGVITITSSVTPDVGWALDQGTTSKNIASVLEVAGGFQLTIDGDIPDSWSTGSADLYPAVGMEWEYISWTAGQAGAMKQCRGVALLTDETFNENSVTKVDLRFKTNFDNDEDSVTLIRPEGGWGASWGGFPWGGGNDTYGYPTYVPGNKQYCNRFFLGGKHRMALQKLAVAGFVVEFEMISEEVGI